MSDVEKKLYSDDNIDVTTFKCPNCGGGSVFDAKTQKLKCLYCGSLFDIPDQTGVVTPERQLEELLDKGEVWKEAEVYQCQSCGAKEIIENQRVSHVCPFCGTKNVVKIEELPGIKPQGIVPFKIDKKMAGQSAKKYVKGKLYAPSKFKKSVKPENIHGIYNPLFTFDCQTSSSYYGKLGKNYVINRIVNGKVISETRTKVFHVSGTYQEIFDDFVVQASSKIPSEIIASLQPFSTRKAVDYKPEYLLGYGANTYDKDGQSCWQESKSMMQNRIEGSILKKYDYDIKYSLNVNTDFSHEMYKYILVPIYVGHYKYKNKLYNFFVNGENGKVAGKTPVSAGKVTLTVFIVLLILGIIALLYYFA